MTPPDLLLTMSLITASIIVLIFLMPVFAELLAMIVDLVILLPKLYKRIIEGKYNPIKELEKIVYELECKKSELIIIHSELKAAGVNSKDKKIYNILKDMNTKIKSMKDTISIVKSKTNNETEYYVETNE